jgi:hypothetical protein
MDVERDLMERAKYAMVSFAARVRKAFFDRVRLVQRNAEFLTYAAGLDHYRTIGSCDDRAHTIGPNVILVSDVIVGHQKGNAESCFARSARARKLTKRAAVDVLATAGETR